MTSPTRRPPPSSLRRRWPWLALAVIGVAATGWYWQGRGANPPGAWRTAEVERGAVRVSISATGSLRALSTVDIGSQVSGQILSVHADFNDRVQQGQVIARIDPATFQARLTQVRADLASARASLEEARASLRNAEADYHRKRELAERQLIARSEADLALAARDQARARVGSAEAAVAQRQAAVANAELDLAHTRIRSPVDGVVLLRAVEPGQTVAASFQTPVLFQIAEDLARMQIELSIDESDVGQIRAGQDVRFTVDAFPGRDFHGRVQQVRLAASNTQNVVTYPVVVLVDNPDGSLLPGMTANAEIEVSRRENVLRVPNAALRFRPADAPAETRPAGGGRIGFNLGEELPRIADGLGLSPAQREAFERDHAAQRERMAQAQGQRPPGGPAGPGMAGGAGGLVVMGGNAGGAAPSPEMIRQMVLKRVLDSYGDFRASLDDGQRRRFEQAVAELLSARRVTLWKEEGGRAVPVEARVGLSDASHTELVGGALAEGERVIVGQERSVR